MTSWAKLSRMRSPIAVGRVKSIGVPATGSMLPVGISVASTGVYRLALSRNLWPSMLPDPSPARLK